MNEHQKETAFLRHLIRYDGSEERRKLGESIAQAQHDERCVRCVAAVTSIFPALAVIGMAYGTILKENYPHDGAVFVIRILCDLGLASLVCLAAFVVLLVIYRRKLNRLREECRRLVNRLMESHLGKPHLGTLPGSHPGPHDDEPCQAAADSGVPASNAMEKSILGATNPGSNTGAGAFTD